MTAQSEAEPAAEDRYPRAFGGYLLLHQLGRGGMGRVELAKTSAIAGIEKYHVVKTVRPDLGDRESVARFLDEARVAVHLHHRNICSVVDVGRVEDEYFLAMEFIPGRTVLELLLRLVDRGEKMPERLALHIVAEMLDALDYAHRLKDPVGGTPLSIVHRDVSPQNVMVSFDGDVKLIDFGLAHSRLKHEQTEQGVVLGKLVYMSPEQARGERVDATVDQRACAVVLYELITGAPFFEGMTAKEVWARIGEGGYLPPRLDQVSEEIAEILQRALADPPGARFATCEEMHDALEEVMSERSLRASARELRALMARVFAEEIDETQGMLARFANVAIVAPAQTVSAFDATRVVARDEVARTEVADAPPTELDPSPPSVLDDRVKRPDATVVALPDRSRFSLLAEPETETEPPEAARSTMSNSATGSASATDEDAEATRLEPAPVTEHVERTPLVEAIPAGSARRTALLAAAGGALGLVAVALIAAVFALRARAPAPEPELAPAARAEVVPLPVDDDAEEEVAPATRPPPSGGALTTDESSSSTETIEPEEKQSDPAAEDPAPVAAPQKRRVERTRRRSSARGSRSRSASSTQRRALPPPPLKGSTLEQASYLKEHCPSLPCLERVLEGLRKEEAVDVLARRAKRCTRTCYLGGR